MSSTLPVTQPTLADHFFYPPVGRLERQWNLYVEGTGYGTWPSELDPVWHPQPFYFRELFKRETGVAPYQYHLAQRLERAQTLLARTAMTVREIAATLRFHDAYHFSRLFKAKTGHCPTEWRRAQGHIRRAQSVP